MNGFDTALKLAIEAYAELSGESVAEVLAAIQAEPNGSKAENIKLLMFAAL